MLTFNGDINVNWIFSIPSQSIILFSSIFTCGPWWEEDVDDEGCCLAMFLVLCMGLWGEACAWQWLCYWPAVVQSLPVLTLPAPVSFCQSHVMKSPASHCALLLPLLSITGWSLQSLPSECHCRDWVRNKLWVNLLIWITFCFLPYFRSSWPGIHLVVWTWC